MVFVGKRRDGFVPVFFDDTREVETDDQPLVGVVLLQLRAYHLQQLLFVRRIAVSHSRWQLSHALLGKRHGLVVVVVALALLHLIQLGMETALMKLFRRRVEEISSYDHGCKVLHCSMETPTRITPLVALHAFPLKPVCTAKGAHPQQRMVGILSIVLLRQNAVAMCTTLLL